MNLLTALLARAAAAPAAPGNLDLLNALRDIHEPAPPGLWPPAPGWWLLALLLLMGLVALVMYLRRRHRRARPVRAGLAELDRWIMDARSGGEPAAHAERLAALLRRVALLRYPRAEVAALTGEAWLRFLDRTGSSECFSVGPGRVLGDDRYAPSMTLDVDTLGAISRRWLEEHLDGANVEPGAAGASASRAAADASAPGARQAARGEQQEPAVHEQERDHHRSARADSGADGTPEASRPRDQSGGRADSSEPELGDSRR